MRFTKMHGAGNDYVYVNCFTEKAENPGELSKFVSDRHFGIGADGLILIKPSKRADFEMAMYNADGSQGKMCGNGIRCVGKFVYDKGLTSKTDLTIETRAGLKKLKLQVEDGKVFQVTVDMGVPVPGETVTIQVDGDDYELQKVSMGNPHAVTFMKEIEGLDLQRKGPVFEYHPAFPERVNTEFVQVVDATHLKMRVWERGSGETLACGTGSCATLVAAVLAGKSERKATIHLLGGDLQVYWDETDGHIYMIGPAVTVFEGEWPR